MELARRQKGKFAPPPMLEHPFQRVAETIASWDGVIATTHWHLQNHGQVDGVDFYVGERELGHIHLEGHVHLATDSELNGRFLKQGRAERFPFGGSYASWTLLRIESEDDADYAIGMFQQNYERLRKAASPT